MFAASCDQQTRKRVFSFPVSTIRSNQDRVVENESRFRLSSSLNLLQSPATLPDGVDLVPLYLLSCSSLRFISSDCVVGFLPTADNKLAEAPSGGQGKKSGTVAITPGIKDQDSLTHTPLSKRRDDNCTCDGLCAFTFLSCRSQSTRHPPQQRRNYNLEK